MSISPSFESKIGFDRIRAQVGEFCTTAGGRQLLDAEAFTFSAPDLQQRLGLAEELRAIISIEGGFPSGEFTDTEHVVSKTRVEGAFLEVEDILSLHRALTSVGEVLDFIASHSDRATSTNPYPLLRALSDGIQSFPTIVGHIESLIDRFGKIRDSASPELFDIRRTIRSREGEVGKRMQRILSQAQSAGIVDADATLSVRDGRTVIPVAAGNKKKLPGFIAGESGSGRTFFIEPVEIVEINNELKELEYAERREIVRILSVFTDSLRPDLNGISQAGNFLIHIDLIRAKARWAIKNGATKPIVSEDGRLVLRQARHPLLAQTLARENRQIIPLDVSLSPAERIIVVSGPNAGGKSVVLKTIALIQYMFQCGFLVPALENSEMPLFRSLFIDIGDEQSIDNDLSTYSSHLLNLKAMLSGANKNSIVFIDEFGSGTEPVIGGAIAEAVLERLLASGTYGVITTHYSNIKYFASNHEGVINGAMAFDVAAIRPLFQLRQGEPGSSFAIEIARKIGLPEQIISSASEKAGSDHIKLERQLREIARDRRYWEQKRDRIRVADRRKEQLEAELEARLAAIKAERAEIIKAAKSEAQSLITEANRQIESTIKTIRESGANKEQTTEARKKLTQFVERKQVKEPQSEDWKTQLKNLVIGSQATRKPQVVSSGISERKLNFSSRLDVRGLRPTEAIDTVEDFIDNALMVGVNEVSILHGKGTGALKSEIRRYLRTIPAVESAVDDHADRGGAGITVVTFKQ